MRKSINIILFLSLMIGFSVTLSAQSSEEELDQVELMKQFIGTWKAEVAEDTIVILKFVPIGGALGHTMEVMAKDTIFYTRPGIYGFSHDKKTVRFAGVDGDGIMSFDYGRFVTDKKYIAEVFQDNTKHPQGIEEVIFISSESFTSHFKWRGEKMTWDIEWTPTLTFNKIK